MKFRLIFACSAAMLVMVPASAQNANVEGRITKLEKEMKAVQRTVFPNGAGKFLEPEIKPADVTGTSQQPAQSAVADLLTRVDALETQLASLTGQVELQGNEARALDVRLKALESAMKEKQVAAAPVDTTPDDKAPVAAAKPPVKSPATPAAAKPSSTRVAAVAKIEKPSTGDGFEDGYNYGYRLWDAKFYPEAQAQLLETVDKYPKHSRISFARNLLGRAYLDDDKPNMAVKVLYENYNADRNAERAPDSLFYTGVALTDLGSLKEACEAYASLAKSYPAVATGRLASKLAPERARAKCK